MPDASTLTAEPGQSVVESAGRMKHPGACGRRTLDAMGWAGFRIEDDEHVCVRCEDRLPNTHSFEDIAVLQAHARECE